MPAGAHESLLRTPCTRRLHGKIFSQ